MAQVDYDLDKHRAQIAPWEAQSMQYLEHYYDFYIHKQDRNIYCLQAPNRVCLVGLMQLPESNSDVNQPASDSTAPTFTRVPNVEKSKVKRETILCTVNDQPIKACMEGMFLGYNPRALADPSLLAKRGPGYLFMISAQHEDPVKQLNDFEKVDTIF
ncbi:hypothetical protein DM01DRAFT_1331097 [Hesseltinella vesiculosa]|uniref:Actin-binding transcription modulator n=1 Tax=Hesseltinella vesiculosa TaxID=101127 RepID=A0A1X2GY38_9FUNG|nr:hypothetical protein DM01DRAFT_1331097 [Hesseltinella vesiculosa]